MKISLIIIALVLALIGWFKRETVPIYITVIIVVLLAVTAVFQIIIEIKDSNEGEKTKYTGEIKPSVVDLLSTEKGIYPKLQIGESGTILEQVGDGSDPSGIFFEKGHISLKLIDGNLKMSCSVKNKNGLMAEIIDNEWKVNPTNSFDRNFSKNAIEVKDNNGEIILQVKHVGDRVQFQGVFYNDNGTGVALIENQNGPGALFGWIDPKKPNKEYRIKPIFRYPSELHLGEMVR